MDALGLSRYLQAPRTPLNVKVARVLQRDGYRVECLSFESLPGLYVAGNLYIPDGAEKCPAILYLCGHLIEQKAADEFQQMCRRFAKLGFVTLVIDTIQLGEVKGYHHGTNLYGWFHLYSRGYMPSAVETWNGIRALDLLSARPEVDPSRLGVCGISGGGASSWWLAQADDRIKAAAPACGTGTIYAHMCNRSVDNHCDCMFPNNNEGKSLVELAAICAPRPVLIVSAAYDGYYNISAIQEFYERLKTVYKHLGAEDKIGLCAYPARHSYQDIGRKATYQFFLKHLQGRDITLDDVPDIDDHLEKYEDLAAFPEGLPANDRSTTVHSWFIPMTEKPAITNASELQVERRRVVSLLKEQTFATFPQPLPDPDWKIDQESLLRNNARRLLISYTSEPGWRLRIIAFQMNNAAARPTIIELLSAQSWQRHLIPEQITPLSEGCPAGWNRISLHVRGTGDTGWSSALQWHLRRALPLTGRTIASLRVLDTLQGLRAVRELPSVDAEMVYLAGEGEMAAVALYAALLDEKIAGVILYNPPATQNQPSLANGSGDSIEMLNCLRITDLPQVAGLLWPTHIIFVAGRPDTYLWTEELYRRLGAPGNVVNVPELRSWQP